MNPLTRSPGQAAPLSPHAPLGSEQPDTPMAANSGVLAGGGALAGLRPHRQPASAANLPSRTRLPPPSTAVVQAVATGVTKVLPGNVADPHRGQSGPLTLVSEAPACGSHQAGVVFQGESSSSAPGGTTSFPLPLPRWSRRSVNDQQPSSLRPAKRIRTLTDGSSSSRIPTATPANDRQTELRRVGHLLQGITTRVRKTERRIDDYIDDPNGFLLIGKQATALGAALEALAREPVFKQPPDTKSANLLATIDALRSRITALPLPVEKPETMAHYIEQRRIELGHDIGNKKYSAQEGRIGADVEMQFGGLRRATYSAVEFLPGDFSPYLGTRRTTPHQLDVFGPPPQVIPKLMVRHAQKIHPQLREVEEESLWNALTRMQGPTSIQLASMAHPVHIDPAVVFESYLEKAKFFQSLERHFVKDKKPTVVLFDSTGLNQWPALMAHVKLEITKRFQEKQHLIVWQDA